MTEHTQNQKPNSKQIDFNIPPDDFDNPFDSKTFTTDFNTLDYSSIWGYPPQFVVLLIIFSHLIAGAITIPFFLHGDTFVALFCLVVFQLLVWLGVFSIYWRPVVARRFKTGAHIKFLSPSNLYKAVSYRQRIIKVNKILDRFNFEMDNTVQSTSEYVLGNWKYFTTNVPKIAPEMIRGLDYEIVSGQVQLLKQLHKKSEPKDKQEMVNALEAYLKL